MTLTSADLPGTPLGRHTDPQSVALPVIPWLPATLRRAWRAPDELQIGADPARAVVLRNVGPDVAAFLSRLDGTRTLRELLERSDTRGVDSTKSAQYRSVVATLSAKGLVIDLADGGRNAGQTEHPLLLGPLAAEVHGRALGTLRATPAATMRMRAAARIVVVGGQRLGPALASILTAAGVRRLSLVQPGAVTPTDLIPGGPTTDDLGRSRIEAGDAAIRRVAPGVTTMPLRTGDRPDLVVLAEAPPADGDRVRMLMRTRTPFLPVSIRERRAVVGPFVKPGESSCLSCQDAVRRDLDSRWAAVDAQLRIAAAVPGDGGETALVMLGASLAAVQVLQWLDDERLPETINATLEIALPELLLERRYWPRHEMCSCRMEVVRGQ